MPCRATSLVKEVPHEAQRARGDEEAVEDAVADEVIGLAPGWGLRTTSLNVSKDICRYMYISTFIHCIDRRSISAGPKTGDEIGKV